MKKLALICLALVWVGGAAYAAKPVCPDGICNGPETALSCPLDCSGSTEVCGNGICGGIETCSSCPDDCGVCPPSGGCNNDGVCNVGEDCNSCGDCPGKLDGKKRDRFCCGGATEATMFCGVGDQCGPSCGTIGPVCGNNIVEAGEQCDDGNLADGDGCDALCQIEAGPVCGNAILETGEQCDDGNTAAGDGCDASCQIEQSTGTVPINQFNIGDSIGEAEAADGTVGSINHESVWSTGFSASDPVNSLNERFEATDANGYYENTSTRDATFNQAISGSVMADFAAQAQLVVDAAPTLPDAAAGQISVFLGNNDVCADTVAGMTPVADFANQFRAGLDILAADGATQLATIHVSSIPAIYWLWESRATDSSLSWCRLFAWPNVPCQNLLSASGDDCASTASRENPDVLDPQDGPNCARRKEFHARIRDEYNPALQSVVAEYANHASTPLPNIRFVDIFDVRFDKQHVNGGDCFHPSLEGQKLLSDEQYCRSELGQGDVTCAQ